MPHLGFFAERPDLAGKTELAEREASGGGMRLVRERALGEKFRVLEFVRPGTFRREEQAVRIVSPFGVVVAWGPEEEAGAVDAELLWHVEGEDGELVSLPRDVDGDGTEDILLRHGAGDISVLSFSERGGGAIPLGRGAPWIGRLEQDRRAFGIRVRAVIEQRVFTFEEVCVRSAGRCNFDALEARPLHKRRLEALGEPPEGPDDLVIAAEDFHHRSRAGLAHPSRRWDAALRALKAPSDALRELGLRLATPTEGPLSLEGLGR